MERILLIEPNYKNKYPPIGLMKISTYYKQKGDFVEFHKGLLSVEQVKGFNKVLITTLFTFDFDICIQTIKYYIAILGIENVYVGGIAATIMPNKFLSAIPNLKINTGQLTSSNLFGYDDNVNIDILELDYDMLWDIEYKYPTEDSYFIYTTRGCPRKCSFCAVKTLEPNFYDCDNIKRQIENVDKYYGPKRDLLIMDNNILYSEHFEDTVNELIDLGFGNNNNKIKKGNKIKYYLKSLKKRIDNNKDYINLLNRIKSEFNRIKISRIKNQDGKLIEQSLKMIDESNDKLLQYLLLNENQIVEFFDRYDYHKITRHVDFNQGLDARLFSEDKAKLLSKLALKPCRIAFDNLKTKDEYFKAMSLAADNGIKNFSNYLLYNYNDKPEDLWTRLHLNIQFREKYQNKEITLFSFPMKYASIEHTDRKYIGKYWNKKFLGAVNIILNVTSGVVAKEQDFFYRAYGHNKKEFIEILSMPDDFIRYREFFDKNGFSALWRLYYKKLTQEECEKLIIILSRGVKDNLFFNHNEQSETLRNILNFYTISKKKYELNPLYYDNMLKDYEQKLKL